MLAYTYLLPSDNVGLNGRFKGSMHALLIPSDNEPILLRRCDAAHYIECAFNILLKYILLKHIIPKHNIQSDNVPKYIFYSEKNAYFWRIYACATPPYPKNLDPVFKPGEFADLLQTKLSFCTLPLVQCRKDIQQNKLLLLEDK